MTKPSSPQQPEFLFEFVYGGKKIQRHDDFNRLIAGEKALNYFHRLVVSGLSKDLCDDFVLREQQFPQEKYFVYYLKTPNQDNRIISMISGVIIEENKEAHILNTATLEDFRNNGFMRYLIHNFMIDNEVQKLNLTFVAASMGLNTDGSRFNKNDIDNINGDINGFINDSNKLSGTMLASEVAASELWQKLNFKMFKGLIKTLDVASSSKLGEDMVALLPQYQIEIGNRTNGLNLMARLPWQKLKTLLEDLPSNSFKPQEKLILKPSDHEFKVK